MTTKENEISTVEATRVTIAASQKKMKGVSVELNFEMIQKNIEAKRYNNRSTNYERRLWKTDDTRFFSSETYRPAKPEIWQSNYEHILIDVWDFDKKHEVDFFWKRIKKKIIRIEYISERMIIIVLNRRSFWIVFLIYVRTT